jgi:ech hydrogenase subunit A
MYALICSLFLLPLLVSGLLLVLPKVYSRILVIVSGVCLSAISIYLLVTVQQPFSFGISSKYHSLFTGLDILLLVFFGWVAIKRKSVLVGLLTIMQIAAFIFLFNTNAVEEPKQFMVDKLSLFMFVLVNVISSVIAVFSLKYIDEEECSSFKKKYFLSIIMWFIAVMNLVVSSDNLEYFFLFFELTTLASYLLIQFRQDDVSVKNALTALWMNQIGGLAIVLAILYINYKGLGAPTFSNLVSHASATTIMMPLAFLSLAACIKGAQMPFSKWLLGAMVAPTPVSALLHSSTMVKIAPFIILRLSPVLKDTPVATVLITLTGFVFVAAAVSALSQDNFKRILAHSTIALLALMIMMAAVGTTVTIATSLILILFHGISKCMLFLNAGIMEKVFHYKVTSEMDKLAQAGPFTSFVITVGFMSLLLPPFGAFIGKWFSIETLSALALNEKIIGAIVIVFLAIGGAVLSLLYFKVVGILIARTGSNESIRFEKTSPFYVDSIYVLLVLLLIGVVGFPILLKGLFGPVTSQLLKIPVAVTVDGWKMHLGAMTLPLLPLLITFFLVPVSIIVGTFLRFKKVDRVKEYACGEKIDYSFSGLYFSTDKATPYLTIIGTLFFVALVVVAFL